MRPAMLATPGWALYQVATELAAHGATTEAQAMAARAVAWVSTQPAPLANSVEQRYVMASALMLTGDNAEARKILTHLAGEDSSSVDLRGSLGVAAARLGDEAAASRTIAWLRGRRGARPVGGPAYYEAAILAALGRTEPALRALERLPHGAHPYNSLALHADPLLAPLRGTETFANLTKPQG
jgi:Flp pilus assembly protein TadD